jgi:inosine-uridine nucleoside N-ribohydrolase
MTNLALAISLDPQFPELAQQLVFMGGSLNPQSDDPEFADTPRHEFNIWFDPEAASIVLRAPWKKIVCTPVDISIKTRFSPEAAKRIEASGTDLARYLARFYKANYMWDELAAAAWIDPTLITQRETRYMNVNLDQGAGYGDTLIWTENDKPKITVQPVEIQTGVNADKLYSMFVNLMSAARPLHTKHPSASVCCPKRKHRLSAR